MPYCRFLRAVRPLLVREEGLTLSEMVTAMLFVVLVGCLAVAGATYFSPEWRHAVQQVIPR